MSEREARCCRECGALVVDKRAHQRWHDRVVTAKPAPLPRGPFTPEDVAPVELND